MHNQTFLAECKDGGKREDKIKRKRGGERERHGESEGWKRNEKIQNVGED